MEQYRRLKNDVSSMLDNLEALEEKLMARVIYWSQESCMSVILACRLSRQNFAFYLKALFEQHEFPTEFETWALVKWFLSFQF